MRINTDLKSTSTTTDATKQTLKKATTPKSTSRATAKRFKKRPTTTSKFITTSTVTAALARTKEKQKRLR